MKFLPAFAGSLSAISCVAAVCYVLLDREFNHLHDALDRMTEQMPEAEAQPEKESVLKAAWQSKAESTGRIYSSNSVGEYLIMREYLYEHGQIENQIQEGEEYHGPSPWQV